MKRVLALAFALACVTGGTVRADEKSEAKKLLPKMREEILVDFDSKFKPVLDPGKLECYKDYNEAVKRARAALSHCLSNPSNGSPLDKFNAMTNAQLIQYCSSIGHSNDLQACLHAVLVKEREWCEDKVDFKEHLAAAKKAEAGCLKCDTLHDELIALEKKFLAAGCGRRLVLQR